MVKVEIITIGDELLIGQVVDTNSPWMAQQLNKAGFDVQYKTTVGDSESDIPDAFERAFSRASAVLVTGGIGPTKDDITKNALCRFFNTRLIFDAPTMETIETVLRGLCRNLNELTRSQAYVPEKATVIQNKMGTAPLTWFEREGKILVSMPGVPYEMKWAMSNEIIPRLQSFFPAPAFILHQAFRVKNYSESSLAMRLEDFENELPAHLRLAYLPSSGLIRLRLTGKGADRENLSSEMSVRRDKLRNLLKKDIVSETDDELENILDKRLKEHGLTLSLAESCTGGKLASLFTAIPGCSHYFKGGITAYSNEAKQNILGVTGNSLREAGAVSRTVVEQMVRGAQRIFNTDCAIATSGIAGPDGGTPEKPVGTVWIAVACKEQLHAKEFHFSQNRESNILRACNMGMQLLLEIIAEI
ncbi:MAG: CinA family nicotinamide mononucleotide deamidase-related protein [Candidatus Symbiothrix sp.]|jgi:nicotinamide-nucleotide amidase|nr:CinA family nicotinamide mononucleotide deamidase-related protein [Candidatus Symbiothrix sp.]